MFKFSSKKIALMAMFISLNVVINFSAFEITFASWKITLSITVCFFAGLFTGFIGGALTGFLGDMLGFFIMPPGFAFNPLLSLTSMLWGLIPGLAFDLYRLFNCRNINLVIGIITIIIVQAVLFVFVSLGATAVILWQSYYASMSFFDFLLIHRIVPCSVDIAINIGLSIFLFCVVYKIPFFKEYLNFDKSEDKVEEQIEGSNH